MLNEIRPNTKGQVLYDSTYLKYQEQANSQKQKVEERLSGAGGRGIESYCLTVTEFLFGMMNKFWKQW